MSDFDDFLGSIRVDITSELDFGGHGGVSDAFQFSPHELLAKIAFKFDNEAFNPIEPSYWFVDVMLIRNEPPDVVEAMITDRIKGWYYNLFRVAKTYQLLMNAQTIEDAQIKAVNDVEQVKNRQFRS